MKQSRILAVTFSFLLLATALVGCAEPPAPTPAPTPTKPEIVTFPDSNLEAAIRDALGKPPDEEILSTELAQLTRLRIQDRGVVDLTGLEYCINLTLLELRDEPITDISPLSSLTNLTDLHLCGNEISDISPLASLTKLTFLAIAVNPVSDLSPLSALTNLTCLDLADDEISDLSPLASLTNLTILCLQGNEVSDISPLSSLTNLTDLRLTQNQVSNISQLVENSGLGAGDTILLGGNNLDLTEGSEDMENIRALEARGVDVSLDPHQWAPEHVLPGAPVPIPE